MDTRQSLKYQFTDAYERIPTLTKDLMRTYSVIFHGVRYDARLTCTEIEEGHVITDIQSIEQPILEVSNLFSIRFTKSTDKYEGDVYTTLLDIRDTNYTVQDVKDFIIELEKAINAERKRQQLDEDIRNTTMNRLVDAGTTLDKLYEPFYK